jgi:hypothetical protein
MSRHQPALLGGLFIGVLSSLPLVNIANVCCCLWVVTGGVLTVYLQQQNQPAIVETGEAAVGGLIAGIVGGVITTLASLLIFSMSGDMIEANVRMMFDQNPALPAEIRDRALDFVSGGNAVFIQAAFTIPIYAVFGMLGALLGLSLFGKKATPPPTPPA